MKAYLSSEKAKTTVIEHNVNGKIAHIEFNNKMLAKTEFVVAVNDDNPIFVHFNRYMEKLPKQRQDQIFELIADIHSEIENSNNLETTNANLTILFNHLFVRINFDEILNLVVNDKIFARDITLPSSDNIKMKYESVSDNYTEDKTYIFYEYQQLIALIIQLRIMFPIWAHYINVFSSSLGTEYKEFEAFKLIQESDLFNNVAMQKLAKYVKASTPEEGSKAAIIDFINSEDYPLYNLALVVVRKICTMELRKPGEKQPVLIMHISTHVKEKINNNEKKQGSIIANKKGEDWNSPEERQISTLEKFKIRDQLTVGQRVFLLESVSNPLDLAKKLKPTVDLDLVSAVIAETIRMNNSKVQRVQKVLLRNIIANVVSSKIVDLMSRDILLGALGATAAVLIEDGYHQVAQFLTATVVTDDTVVTIASDQHQNKVTTELRDKVISLMPFQRSSRAKSSVSKILDNVDAIFKELTNKVWHSNLPDHVIASDGGAVIRRIKIPNNLRVLLTEFAVYLIERPSPIINAETKLNNIKF